MLCPLYCALAHHLLCLPVRSCFLPAPALPLLRPFQEQSRVFTTVCFTMEKELNMPVWLQTAAIILSLLFCASEHSWGVLQLTPEMTEQHKEGLTWVVITGEVAMGFWLASVANPAIQCHISLRKLKCHRNQAQARTADEGTILNITYNTVGPPLISYKFKSLDENRQREYNYHSTW